MILLYEICISLCTKIVIFVHQKVAYIQIFHLFLSVIYCFWKKKLCCRKEEMIILDSVWERICERFEWWEMEMMLCVCVWTLFVSLKKKVFIYIGNCLDIKNITSINCTEFMFSTSIPYCWHSTAVRMGIQNFFFFFWVGFTLVIYIYIKISCHHNIYHIYRG